MELKTKICSKFHKRTKTYVSGIFKERFKIVVGWPQDLRLAATYWQNLKFADLYICAQYGKRHLLFKRSSQTNTHVKRLRLQLKPKFCWIKEKRKPPGPSTNVKLRLGILIYCLPGPWAFLESYLRKILVLKFVDFERLCSMTSLQKWRFLVACLFLTGILWKCNT